MIDSRKTLPRKAARPASPRRQVWLWSKILHGSGDEFFWLPIEIFPSGIPLRGAKRLPGG
jgi:hypothetical protein